MKEDLKSIIKENEEISNRMNENRVRMVAAIVEMLKENDGDINLYERMCECDDELPVISYDGGRHPEYASSIATVVYGVKLHQNHDGEESFSVDIDEDCNYEEYRMMFHEVKEIFNVLCKIENGEM